MIIVWSKALWLKPVESAVVGGAMTPPPTPKPPLDDTLAAFGARMRARREELGLSQEEAAERATIHSSNFARIERGQQSPRVQLLVRIADSLETTPGALLDDLPLPPPVSENDRRATRIHRRRESRSGPDWTVAPLGAVQSKPDLH